MQINSQLPVMSLSFAPSVVNPVRDYTKPLEAKNTKGTISVVYRYDEPSEVKIEFEPKVKTKFPFIDAKRVININIKTGHGTMIRESYIEDGKTIPEASVPFRSDIDYNIDEKKPPSGLLANVLGQDKNVSTATEQYNDIANLPVIKAYSDAQKTMLFHELEKLTRKKK